MDLANLIRDLEQPCLGSDALACAQEPARVAERPAQEPKDGLDLLASMPVSLQVSGFGEPLACRLQDLGIVTHAKRPVRRLRMGQAPCRQRARLAIYPGFVDTHKLSPLVPFLLEEQPMTGLTDKVSVAGSYSK